MAKTLWLALLLTVMPGCQNGEPVPTANAPQPGIPLTIATERAQSIKDLRYDLSLTIPDAVSAPVVGRIAVRFTTDDVVRPLVLDFDGPESAIHAVRAGGAPASYRVANGHIILDGQQLSAGENAVEIDFHAGDAPLNRTPDFMYALFVPARAHLAFPCFDQPDLKARYTLELNVPAGWQAVSNGAEAIREQAGERLRIRYAETQPIPTYLFSFAAGRFQIETAERNGRTFRMFHRETDVAKLQRNRDAVFDLHASSLEWLEDYTAIPYPFGKFDFVVIPAFQFGGMEHPGAIFYNASSILLDESATENQFLNRASLIAHETAHMWFGDLVTMKWFSDVWMKEVFANFMAAKIVNPQFPNVNHELRFLAAHYPQAYSVDRTPGTHPIRQELGNLNEAGSLYGAIIYQKAPIVMRQLEMILGPERFQDGLRVYLKNFSFGNATWLDLVQVLDERTELDLAAWSKAWVEESGRPIVRTELDGQQLAFVQSDPQPGRSLRWTQKMEVVVGNAQNVASVPVDLVDERTEVSTFASMPRPDFVLPTGGGLAYGGFVLDTGSRRYLLEHLPELKDPVTRGAAWITLWEEMLERRVAPAEILNLVLRALPVETTEQNINLMLGYLDGVFWRFLPEAERQAIAPAVEEALRRGLTRAGTSSLKSTYFSTFRSVVTTDAGTEFLARVWRRQEQIPGLVLSEQDEATMALELAVREVDQTPQILEEQRSRFRNPDRKAQFEFVMPALSSDAAVRSAWFGSLADVRNRRREPWVLEGLRYLNHPLRAGESEKHLRAALDLLVEIQRTGDIFFPRNWMDATIGRHNSPAAAGTVREFLQQHTDYPVRLRRVILQAADVLFRTSEMAASNPGQ